MSILINMEMPKEPIAIIIRPDGKVFRVSYLEQIATAIPVSPHGRLIDADVLEEELERVWNSTEDYEFANHDSWKTLHAAPTIIPAEKEDAR